LKRRISKDGCDKWDVLFLQGELVPDEFVPKVGLKFDALEDAYEYYCNYTKLVGFDVRKGRKSSDVQWFFCNKERRCDSKNVEKKTEKGSVRIGCKGHLKAKLDKKEGYWYYDIVDLKHNHKLTPNKRMVHFMRSHKCLEDGIKNLMDVMTRAGVPHATQMNVMLDLHGGRDN
jgi:hypothetical protein